MIAANGVCGRCGAKIVGDTTREVCPACLLETALDGSTTTDGDRFGVYEIERHPDGGLYELGRGAMGVTYRAIDTSLQRKVALKIIKIDVAERSADARERFMCEARAAAALRHENIATVYQFGIREDTGQYFYAMELIEGETLEQRVRRAGPLDARTTINIAQQVTAALAAAEKHGLVHRDLKPANLMLVFHDGEIDNNEKVVVKIIDFGLAKALNAPVGPMSLTRSGFVGTPAFASPEQFEHSALDVRSDIYSLGETLWFALTGKTLFAGHSAEEIQRVQQANVLPIEQLKAAHVPSGLRSLLASMLALEPASRAGTHELAARLQRCSPEARSARRTRVALAAAALLLLGVSPAFIFLSLRNQNSHSNLGILEKSIAVLPFENLSEEKANTYFADGVQDEILTDLAKIADLKVISRTSVLNYKSGVARNLREIAQQLGVANVVEGSVQRSGNRVRVNAQLVDARNDAHLWAQTYDRDLEDVFAIQSEIAKAIADQLQAKLSPREKAAIEKLPTTNLAAYDLYLHAQALYADTTGNIPAGEKLPQAARLLDEVVARDPHFLLAWCLLIRVHGALYSEGYDHTSARLDLANAAVQAALRLEPDAGETHLALAEYYYHVSDYGRARSELAIAQRTLPNNAEVFEYTGYIERREGHWEEATRELERAVELDPRNFLTLQQLAIIYSEQRRYADQARTLDRALMIVPGDPLTRITRAGVAIDWRADIKPFQTTLAAIIAENPSVPPGVDDHDWALCERTAAAAARMLTHYPRDGEVINGVNFPHTYWEGVVARCQGDSAKAQAAFTAARGEVEKTVDKQPDFAAALSFLGMIDAGLGRKEEALREGRRACELLPISKDAIDGVTLAVNLAQIYTWTGEKDLAIEQIAAVERVPNYLTYGLLQLHPYWDSLRGDPRFEKIVASLAPKKP